MKSSNKIWVILFIINVVQSFVLYTPAVKLGKSFIYSFWFQLVEHFFQSLVNTSGMTLHIRQVTYCYMLIAQIKFSSK